MGQALAALRGQAAVYPFLTALDEPIEALKAVTGQPYTFYLLELRPREDALLDLKDGVIEPVRRFMSGTHKQIYDDARAYLQAQEANFSYVGKEEAGALYDLLTDPRCYQGNKMQQAKTLLDSLRQQVTARVQAERAQAAAKVDERWQRLAGMGEFNDLTAVQQTHLQQPFTTLKQRVEGQLLIAVIRDMLNQFDRDGYQSQLRQMTVWAAANTAPPPIAPSPGEKPRVVIEPRIEYVAQQTLHVPFSKAWLADESDVDAYLSLLKQTMLQAIQDGKRIQV